MFHDLCVFDVRDATNRSDALAQAAVRSLASIAHRARATSPWLQLTSLFGKLDAKHVSEEKGDKAKSDGTETPLPSIGGRVFHWIIRHGAVSGGRINKTVSIVLLVYRLKK